MLEDQRWPRYNENERYNHKAICSTSLERKWEPLQPGQGIWGRRAKFRIHPLWRNGLRSLKLPYKRKKWRRQPWTKTVRKQKKKCNKGTRNRDCRTTWQRWVALLDGKIIHPRQQRIITLIIKNKYDSTVAGHFGIDKTVKLVQSHFYRPNIVDWMTDNVRASDNYQHNKSIWHKRFNLEKPLVTAHSTWVSISTDFILQVTESKEPTQKWLVVNWFTNMAHFIRLKERAKQSNVTKVFLDNIWKICSIPKQIDSDQDNNFTSEFWISLCMKLDIKSSKSMAPLKKRDKQSELIKPCDHTSDSASITIKSFGKTPSPNWIWLQQFGSSSQEEKSIQCKSRLSSPVHVDCKSECHKPCI